MNPIRKEVIIGDCRLLLGDMREILPLLQGAIITDPPYGIEFSYASHLDTEAEFLDLIGYFQGRSVGLLQYPEEMMRLVCPILGPPSEVLTWIYNSNLPRQTRLWGFWNCDVDPARSKQLAKNPEVAKVRNLFVAGYDWRDLPQVKNTSGEKTAHPCQLPLAVADWVLDCVEASEVIDPFMGSGTIVEACSRRGIRVTGIEIDEGYFDIACDRIRKAYAQPDFFVAPRDPQPVQDDMFGSAA